MVVVAQYCRSQWQVVVIAAPGKPQQRMGWATLAGVHEPYAMSILFREMGRIWYSPAAVTGGACCLGWQVAVVCCVVCSGSGRAGGVVGVRWGVCVGSSVGVGGCVRAWEMRRYVVVCVNCSVW